MEREWKNRKKNIPQIFSTCRQIFYALWIFFCYFFVVSHTMSCWVRVRVLWFALFIEWKTVKPESELMSLETWNSQIVSMMIVNNFYRADMAWKLVYQKSVQNSHLALLCCSMFTLPRHSEELKLCEYNV